MKKNENFSEFCERTYDGLNLYVLKLTGGNNFLADDIVQNTYLTAQANQSVLASHKNPVGWLHITAKNLFYKELSNAKKILKSEQDLTEDIADNRDYFGHIDDGFENTREYIILTRIYAELSVEEKKILNYRHIRKMKFREIAGKLDRTVDYVRRKHYKLLSYILNRILSELNNENEDG